MAEEEESKRRKEDMVSTFMKLKMRKEERFEALNVAKLMEQWRSLMRIAKSRDLQGDVRVLMDSFNRHVKFTLLHAWLGRKVQLFSSQGDPPEVHAHPATDAGPDRVGDAVRAGVPVAG